MDVTAPVEQGHHILQSARPSAGLAVSPYDTGRWLAGGLQEMGIRKNAVCVILCCAGHTTDRQTAIAASLLLGCTSHVLVPDAASSAPMGAVGRPTVVLACPEGEAVWSAMNMPAMVVGAALGTCWWKPLELRGRRVFETVVQGAAPGTAARLRRAFTSIEAEFI